MHFQFLLSGPHGDIEPCPEELVQPFLISPKEQHPFLTLADYFGALQKFIMLDDGIPLSSALEKIRPQADINSIASAEVVIRSEKHGAFYHIASVEIIGLGENIKFSLTTALSDSAKTSLQLEFGIVQNLSSITSDYLPELFYRRSVTWQKDTGAAEFLMVFGEWFDSHHEWHVSNVPGSNRQKIKLWDYDNGCRFLSDTESYEMLRQVAYILTCYYDQTSFCQIYPWHHGAGDFIVKPEPGAVSVKLITARLYEPLVHFDGKETADPLVAAIHFLLNLVLRIRLDRLHGVGKPCWLDNFAVHAAVEGFFAGLHASATPHSSILGPAADFLEIIQSFDTQEIVDMYGSLLQIYADEDQEDFRLIEEKISDHASQLHDALQDFTL